MKKVLTFAAAAIAASFVSVSAQASIIDFVAEAAGNERGVASGTQVTINGNVITLNSNFSPYFDDLSAGRPAGLGVCRVLDAGAQCDPSDDDSIDGEGGIAEYVEVVFDSPFSINGLSFYDSDHVSIDDSAGQLLINGMLTTFADAVAAAANGDFAGLESIRFTYVNTDFYIGSISDVPIPGAIPLLLSGLAGLGFAGRKKKKTA